MCQQISSIIFFFLIYFVYFFNYIKKFHITNGNEVQLNETININFKSITYINCLCTRDRYRRNLGKQIHYRDEIQTHTYNNAFIGIRLIIT